MIKISNLCKSYGRLSVLNGLNFELKSGCITGLAGPNACGKSTLIKSILGLVIPESGDIRIGTRLANDVNCRELIGYMPQNAEFPSNLHPGELFKLLSSLRQAKPVKKDELIECFAIQPFLKKPIGNLSAGTRQKISAVAALMFDPPLLILDEPTAGFDPVACVHFKKLILEARARGTTILIVSHIMPELEQLIDDLIFLLDGQIIFSGAVEELNAKTGNLGLENGIVRLMSANNDSSKGARK